MFARLELVAFAVTAVVVASTCQGYAVFRRDLPANCARSYSVVPDDTCDKISANQSVSTFQLAHANTGVIDPACDNLWVDEVICLGITGQDCTTTHKVVTGDSCFSISQAAGIELSVLIANNPNVDGACDNIYPDEVLCTASTLIPYTN